MVGIISFHCQYNFGSALQAWAMQNFFTKTNIENVILNYYYEYNMRTYDIRWYSKSPAVIGFDFLTLIPSIRRKNAYRRFMSDHFKMTSQTKKWEELKSLSKECDTLICGSDQIWNFEITQGVNPAYFLKFSSENQRKIAYAPSISIASIPGEYREEIKRELQTFDAISVREKNHAEELSTICDRKVAWVADPTLLLDKYDYNSLIDNYELKLPKKYVFLYCIHHGNLKRLQEYAEYVAEKLDAQIVYFNKTPIFNKRFSLNIFSYDPRAFLCAIRGAGFVVSDSYHAGIFSILYEKEFATYALQDSISRMNSLFNKLGIENRFITDKMELPSKIDYVTVAEKVEWFRRESKDYLLSALGNKHEYNR